MLTQNQIKKMNKEPEKNILLTKTGQSQTACLNLFQPADMILE